MDIPKDEDWQPPHDRFYPIRTNCINCHALIKESPCPFCQTLNDIEYGPDFEAEKKEYDRYDEV